MAQEGDLGGVAESLDDEQPRDDEEDEVGRDWKPNRAESQVTVPGKMAMIRMTSVKATQNTESAIWMRDLRTEFAMARNTSAEPTMRKIRSVIPMLSPNVRG